MAIRNVGIGQTYATFADAQAAAFAGDEIVFHGGSYGSILITKDGLTLKNAAGEAVTFTGSIEVAAGVKFTNIVSDDPANFTVNATGQAALYLVGDNDASNFTNLTLVSSGNPGSNAVLTGGNQNNVTFTGNTFSGDSAQLVYVNGEASLGVANASSNVNFINNTFEGDSPVGPLLGIESTGGQITGNQFTGDSGYGALELWGAGNTVTGNDFSGNGPAFVDSSNTYDADDLVNDNTGASDGMIYIEGKTGFFTTIQAAINAADPNDTIYVGDGTYNENIQITKSLTLLSVNGNGATVIQGSQGGGGLGTIMITPGVNDVTIGDAGQGFHVIGYDGPTPGIEHASIYLQGAHNGITIRGNNVEAAGDGALVSEFNAALSNIVIDQNEFSGTTFVGQPGIGDQFTVANVARPLVFLGTNNASPGGPASDITFTNNVVSGTAGGTTTGGQNVGNVLVNIDATNAVITGNDFTGFTNAPQLRSREENPTIEDNTFSNNAGGTTGLQVLDDGVPGTVANNTVGDNPVVLTTASGTVLGFDTIQEAINAIPNAGTGTITVAAGLYIEQLVVSGKNVTIVGAGEGQTIIQSPEAVDLAVSFTDSMSGRPTKYAVVAAVNGANLDISNLTIDGDDNGQITPPVNGDFVGLYGHNSSIDADDVTVTGIRDVVVGGPLDGQPSGVQRTHAVIVTIYSGSHTFEMTDSTISNFQKNAFVLFGAGLTVNLVGNEIIGAGAIGSTAQNGIQLSGGATGVIDGNTISGFAYVGTANAASTSILLFDADGIVVTNNVITGDTGNNEYGIYLSGIDGATIDGNTLVDLGFAIAADGSYTTPPDVSGNTFTNNNVNYTTSPTGTGPFTFIGTEEADQLRGSNLGDNFYGNGGNDLIDGNGGIDTAHYTETLDASDFTFNTGNNSWVVNAGSEGTDTVRDVEIIDHGGANNILLVGGGGYATIQAAINAASAGDTILIAEGTYNENVVVNKDGLTIVGVGDVVIEGTFHTDNTVVGDTYTWLADTPGYNGNSGAGVTIDADNVTLQGVTIQSFLHGISFGDGVDSTLIKDVDVKSGVMGYHKPASSDVTNLTIEGGSISDVYIGMDVPKTATSGDGNLVGFTMDGTTFFDITQKGLYIETLYNALITNIDMTNVGQHGGGTAFGAHAANGAGIDINLKYEDDYNDITISNFTMTDVGLSDGSGGSHLPGSPHGNSGAITIKARDDATSYHLNPAEFDGIVQILNGVIDGTSTGIRIGENGKTVAGPAANIQNVTVTNAVVQDYVNQTLSQVVVGDGAGNDLYVGNISVNDTVTYTDTLDASDFSFAGGTWSVDTDTQGNDTLFDIEVVEHGGAGKFLLVGNGGFATIQAAINAAADGDVILVAPGTHTENLTINKAVSILGAHFGDAGTDGSRDAAAGSGETSIIGKHVITAGGDVTLDGIRFVNNGSYGSGFSNATITVQSDFDHTITNSVFYSTVQGGGTGNVAIMNPPSTGGTTTISDNYFTGSHPNMFSTASWDRAIWTDGGGTSALFVTNNTFEYVRTGINLDLGGNGTASVTGNTFAAAGSGVSVGVTPNLANITLEDNVHGTVGTDFNFQNLTGPITFDASEAVAGVTPTDGFITILGSKGGDTITLTEFADVVDGKAGNDTLVYGDLTGAIYEYDNTNDAWKVTTNGVTDILKGVEKLSDGVNEVRLVGGGSEYATIADATAGGFTGTVLTASEPTAPIDDDAAANVVAENATTGTTVGIDVSSTDAETGVTYSLADDANGAFQIDANTGIVTVLDGSKLDYEATESLDIVVRATNAYGATKDSTFTIDLTDVNDNAPVLTNTDPLSIDENETLVATLTSSDADTTGESASYTITGGTDAALFDIVGDQLVFKAAPDFEGGDNSYQVEVTASDGTNQSSKTYTVNVNDVNDNAPVITNNASYDIDENSTVVTTLTSTDADTTGEVATYSVTGGADAALFEVVGGQLVFKSAPDYETDASSYEVEVTADDGVNQSTKTITVNVNDLNDTAPVITTAATHTINENTTYVTALTATDADTTGDTITFSISGGADAALFDIVGGQLVFKSAPDYETDPHSYEVEVTASDGANSSSQTITVNIDDVPTDNTLKAFNAFGPVVEGTTTIGNVLSGGDATGLSFAILPNIDGPQFAINANGDLSFVTGPDYENPADTGADNVYRVTVAVSDGDGKSDIRTFDIEVTDAPMTGLVDTNGAANTIAENSANGTLVNLTVSGTDGGGAPASPYTNTKYSLVDDANGRFTIDENTGVVTVLNGSLLDYEMATFHTITVRADDEDSSAFFEEDFTINLTDVAGNTIIGTNKVDLINATTTFGGKATTTGNNATKEADFITAGNGNDIVDGLEGDDVIDGGAGNDTLNGGDGDDRLTGAKGVDTYNGGEGNDTFVISANLDQKSIFAGGNGFDTIEVTGTKKVTLAGFDVLNGIEAWDGNGMELVGTGKGEVFNFSNLTVVEDMKFFDGLGGNDIITGSATVGMELRGGAGNDTITGGDGNDIIIGGAGLDTLDGGKGNDTFVLSGNQDAKDTIQGGDGTDTIEVAGKGNLTLNGFDSNASSIENWVGNGKAVIGSSGDDTFDFSNVANIGGTGIQYVDAGNGNDTLTANNQGMELRGGAGNDILNGGDGEDTLIGGAGNDTLNGGDGDDRLEAGAGVDSLTGGDGVDTFVFAKGTGQNTITDFELGTDIIELKGIKSTGQLTFVDQLGSTQIVLDNNTSITLVGVDINLSSSINFEFV